MGGDAEWGGGLVLVGWSSLRGWALRGWLVEASLGS